MLAWIVRIFFALAAPITALFVSRDVLNFDVIQTMVAIMLIVAFIALIGLWPKRPGSPL